MRKNVTTMPDVSVGIGDRPSSLADHTILRGQLVDLIGRDIVGGVYPPESRLPDEDSIRRRYSVSRTALREAYSKLTAKGLLAPRPKVGTVIRAREHWNMLDQDVLAWHLQMLPISDIATDLYALRRMVEPGAAELAAKTRNDEDLRRINAALAGMNAHADEEAALVEADFAFHLGILNATNNPFITAFSALIRAAMISTFEISWRGAEVNRDVRLDQHKAVADAIAARAPERARALMEVLLEESLTDVRQALNP